MLSIELCDFNFDVYLQVYFEQNGMGNKEFNGTLIAFDVDVAENLTFLYNETANGTFELTDINRQTIDQFVVCGNGLVSCDSFF